MAKAKALIGFLSENEATNILSQGVPNPDAKSLKQRWLIARENTQKRQYVSDLQPDIREIESKEHQEEITKALMKITARLSAEPQVFGDSWKFKLIEIRKLVAIQKTVNVEVAEDMVRKVENENDLLGAIRVALDTEMRDDKINMTQDTTGYTITSRNLNLAPVGVGIGEIPLANGCDNIHGVNFAIGCRQSYVNVLHYGDRYILKDGYHRTYGLMSKGFTHVPCILVEGSEQTQIPQGGSLFLAQLTLSENPPVLRDFVEIAEDVQVADFINVVKVRVEQSRIAI